MGASSLSKSVAEQSLKKIGIIAALPAEAACLHSKKITRLSPVEIQKDVFLCLSGMGHESATNAAKKLLNLNVDALISWGVAGALEPSLKSGDVVFANSVVTQNRTYQTSHDWNQKIFGHFQNTLENVFAEEMTCSNQVCSTIENKKDLLHRTNAKAIDMESAAIAEVAEQNNLNFIVIRAIADEATTSIPDAVINHTNNLGKPDLLKFALSCLSKPSQFKEIMALATGFKTALKSLNKVAEDIKNHNFFYV
jgi:adenosylhomocysteine nucleosidase